MLFGPGSCLYQFMVVLHDPGLISCRQSDSVSASSRSREIVGNDQYQNGATGLRNCTNNCSWRTKTLEQMRGSRSSGQQKNAAESEGGLDMARARASQSDARSGDPRGANRSSAITGPPIFAEMGGLTDEHGQLRGPLVLADERTNSEPTSPVRQVPQARGFAFILLAAIVRALIPSPRCVSMVFASRQGLRLPCYGYDVQLLQGRQRHEKTRYSLERNSISGETDKLARLLLYPHISASAIGRAYVYQACPRHSCTQKGIASQ